MNELIIVRSYCIVPFVFRFVNAIKTDYWRMYSILLFL